MLLEIEVVFLPSLLWKGRMKDDATLRENKVTNGSKIMVVGSTVTDVLAVNEPVRKPLKGNEKAEAVVSKEPLCKQKVKLRHCRLIVSQFT